MRYLSQEEVFPNHDINDITEHENIIWIATDGPVVPDSYLSRMSIPYTPYKPTAPIAIEIANRLYPSVILNYDENYITFDYRAIDTSFSENRKGSGK